MGCCNCPDIVRKFVFSLLGRVNQRSVKRLNSLCFCIHLKLKAARRKFLGSAIHISKSAEKK